MNCVAEHEAQGLAHNKSQLDIIVPLASMVTTPLFSSIHVSSNKAYSARMKNPKTLFPLKFTFSASGVLNREMEFMGHHLLENLDLCLFTKS